jgi:predicted TIM-barrel fold metal-dependent hydrolase
MERIMIISSDGHVAPKMRSYREYIDPDIRAEFDDFCDDHDKNTTGHPSEGRSLKMFVDEDLADKWDRTQGDTGRMDGLWDSDRRLEVLEGEGVCAEVLIPDFGLPFQLHGPAVLRELRIPGPSAAQIQAGDRAFNRWLADFVSTTPERYAGMANIQFEPVDAAVEEIKHAKENGLKGVMIPTFDAERPLFNPEFDPIWSALEDTDLPLCSHAAISLTSNFGFNYAGVPHPGCAGPLSRAIMISFCQGILDHMVWGGVFERHPRLRVVFTEEGSGWIPGKLAQMDYTYTGSYMRQDIKSVIKHSPSEYFQRQCWIGSSLLATSEVEARYLIGVDKMMVGTDYPHFEGSWNGGNIDYLQATFGPAHVPVEEARMMLGETIAKVYDFDVEKLRPIAERIGPAPERILTPPTEDKFPRGDVHKPLGGFTI